MSKLMDSFNKEAAWDHAKGAALGFAFGFALTPTHFVGAIACAVAGGIIGEQRLVETFSAAFKTRDFAYATVTARAPKP